MKLTKPQAKMLARLTKDFQPVHQMGKGFTFATACALEKKGLAIVSNVIVDTGIYFWGVKLKTTK